MVWSVDGGPEVQHAAFQLVCRNNQASSLAEIVVCNSFLEAEATAFELFPDILPIGPLFADQRKTVGQFLPEDTRCLDWLDGHPDSSVVYLAFGTSTVFDPRQFKELSEGLELTGRPFLWVVRPDFASGAGVGKAWFEEFETRVAGKGMVVGWCSQQQVLAHRAVACFVSHCGWNSTMEGVRNGVPFLCWSGLKVDQYANRSYVCDIWRTGLAVSPGEDGVVTKEEVSAKVEQVIGYHGIADRARVLGDAARRSLGEGGSSYENFRRFISLLME
jgi:UDP:flavonoid glycosyltransferase YjiC (YdhE family)